MLMRLSQICQDGFSLECLIVGSFQFFEKLAYGARSKRKNQPQNINRPPRIDLEMEVLFPIPLENQ